MRWWDTSIIACLAMRLKLGDLLEIWQRSTNIYNVIRQFSYTQFRCHNFQVCATLKAENIEVLWFLWTDSGVPSLRVAELGEGITVYPVSFSTYNNAKPE